jgi:hypothetical protein
LLPPPLALQAGVQFFFREQQAPESWHWLETTALDQGRDGHNGFSHEKRDPVGPDHLPDVAVWSSFVLLDALRSLLSLTELAEDKLPVREQRARGVEEVFRSERYRVKTQGAYYILRPAVPCL